MGLQSVPDSVASMRPSIILVAAAVATSACVMRKAEAWLDPSASVSRPVFGIARSRADMKAVASLNYVAVRSCYVPSGEQETFWQVRAGGVGLDEPPVRISYGLPPRGFTTEIPPTELRSGCYEVLLSGEGVSASVRFTIAGDSISQNRP